MKVCICWHSQWGCMAENTSKRIFISHYTLLRACAKQLRMWPSHGGCSSGGTKSTKQPSPMKKSSRKVIQMVVHVILSYPPGKYLAAVLFIRVVVKSGMEWNRIEWMEKNRIEWMEQQIFVAKTTVRSSFSLAMYEWYCGRILPGLIQCVQYALHFVPL